MTDWKVDISMITGAVIERAKVEAQRKTAEILQEILEHIKIEHTDNLVKNEKKR